MSKAEGVRSVLFRRGVAMEDGRRAKNGSEELMMGVDISSPLSSTQIFFVILLLLNTFLLATAGARI
jgi:hypothetical protein